MSKINPLKDEAVKVIAERAGTSVVGVQTVVKEFGTFVTECLMQGASVQLPLLGIMGVNDVSAREGINPQTGGRVQIAATKRVSFKASKMLKESLKESM